MRHSRTPSLGALPTAVLVAAVITSLFALGLPARAQDEPFIVHDTKPVIMHGPYLSALSETGATIVWTTDTPCHARVVFGPQGEPLSREADNAAHGLLPIGTRHIVHLAGLEPGRAYTFQAVATRVVKMKAYWPEKGLAAESPPRTFTTFDRTKPSISFSAVADTHEDAARVKDLLGVVEGQAPEFLVHLGDAFHSLENEDQLFSRWFDPANRLLAGSKLLLFVRGNHEMRGVFARDPQDYVPAPEGRYYFARDHGPLHLIVLDTGEDKADARNVYAELTRSSPTGGRNSPGSSATWRRTGGRPRRRSASSSSINPIGAGPANAAPHGRRWPTAGRSTSSSEATSIGCRKSSPERRATSSPRSPWDRTRSPGSKRRLASSVSRSAERTGRPSRR
jgi:hypothetical protein